MLDDKRKDKADESAGTVDKSKPKSRKLHISVSHEFLLL
jgi:hypothetical protein